MSKKWLLILSLASTLAFADEFADEFSQSAQEMQSTSSGRADFEFLGGVEVEQGLRTSGTGAMKQANSDWTMAHRRLKIKAQKNMDKGGLYAKIYFTKDDVTQDSYIDFRELRLQYKAFSWMDLSIGRQVSTWGVGDMLFINDLFPKDWKALFRGMDMEYLKAPSNSLRMTNYLGALTWDLVYTPQFTPDNVPRGCHLTTYDPNTRSIVTDPNACLERDNTAEGMVNNDSSNGEVATQLKWDVSGHQLALYAYRGFYKNPRSARFDSSLLISPLYPRLNAYGFSEEGQIGPGIFTLEYGYYDSIDDTDTDLLIENSMHKFIVGYKMDLNSQLTLGAQIYGEYMTDYDQYQQLYTGAMGSTVGIKKEQQHTYTLRVMYKAFQETLIVNWFTYFRPDDKDMFSQLDFNKKLNTNFSLGLGYNYFSGDQDYLAREFSSVKDEDSFYVRLRYDL